MGNQQSRTPDMANMPGSSSRAGHQNNERQERQERTRNRLSRADFFPIYGGSGSGSHSHDATGSSGAPELGEDEPFRRKETRQERESRKREKERIMREKERERSLREEGVDGGYLVTLGTYIGPEDFGKSVVRQLQIERRLAPFWKGLDSHDPYWTDYQFACAVRGLPVPASHATAPAGFFESPPATSSGPSILGAQNLVIPAFGSSDHSFPDQTSASPFSNKNAAPPPRATSPFRSRGTRIAAALSFGSSRSPSETEPSTGLREVMLPPDNYINGQPIEAALYRNALDCPICFLSYPPYLNYTRCCLQPICSECFVQIRRPDPHLPDHHGGGEGSGLEENHELDGDDELVSEASTCPYCQQTQLGVTYDPPPFRRGLVYALPAGEDPGLASQASAHTSSSQTSLVSTPASPTTSTRRRTQSLSATAPNVVTTDRIRPDWAVKLYTAQQIRARRAAAATALHTAAFMSGHQSTTWGGRLALFRRMTESGPSSSPTLHRSDQPSSFGGDNGMEEPGPHGRSRLDELEQVMVQEAIRQSLVHQGEHARKEAKKKDKEERKAKEKEQKSASKQQKAQASIYGSGGTSSTASRSSLSLPFGRMRGNSTSSILRFSGAPQKTLQNHGEPEESSSPSQPSTRSKGKAPDRSSSHLRHISNASSMQSAAEGPAGHPHILDDSQESRASAASLGSANDSDGGNTSGDDPDPLFNYRSMAEDIGIDIDTGRISDSPAAILHSSRMQDQDCEGDDPRAAQSVATLKPPSPQPGNNFALKHNGTFGPVFHATEREDTLVPPELVVTPGTPVSGPGEGSDKTLGIGPSRVVESREMM